MRGRSSSYTFSLSRIKLGGGLTNIADDCCILRAKQPGLLLDPVGDGFTVEIQCNVPVRHDTHSLHCRVLVHAPSHDKDALKLLCCRCMIWYDMIRYGMVWYDDMIWYGMVWYDMIWYDMVWYGMI